MKVIVLSKAGFIFSPQQVTTLEPHKSLSRSTIRLLRLPPLHVTAVYIQKHVPARYPCIQFGADEEGAGHLSVEGVRLLGRRGEAVAKHDGDEALDALRRALDAKVERLS